MGKIKPPLPDDLTPKDVAEMVLAHQDCNAKEHGHIRDGQDAMKKQLDKFIKQVKPILEEREDQAVVAKAQADLAKKAERWMKLAILITAVPAAFASLWLSVRAILGSFTPPQ